MTRALALGLTIFLGSSAIVTYHGFEPASASPSATPSAIALDCTNATTLGTSSSVDPLGANRLITGQVGDTFTITNSTLSDAGDAECHVYKESSVFEGSGNASNQGTYWVVTDSLIPENPGPFPELTLRIVGSGTFIVKTGAGTGAVTFNVDACDLDGSGIAAEPWLVGSASDFQKVGFTDTETGGSSCGLSGHYLQTAHLDSSGTGILNNYSEDRVTGEFTGTYDGDHYRIGLGGSDSGGWNYNGPGDNGSFSERLSLFDVVDGGTIKRVRVSGNIKSSSEVLGGVVGKLRGGGVISEVSSSVDIDANHEDPFIGGIIGEMDGSARVQYSRSTSNISWVASSDQSGRASIGGIVGEVSNQDSDPVREVRDSYYTGHISINSANYNVEERIELGGIIGSLNDPGNFVRTYSVGSASDSCVNPAAPADPICAVFGRKLTAGALSGSAADNSVFVSNFFLRSGLFQSAVGVEDDEQDDIPVAYNNSNEPVAVPLSATRLKQIATYTTLQDGSSNEPGGPEMADDATTDFRWAIEGISAQTFVPSSYDDPAGVDEGDSTEIADYTKRVVYASTGERFYRTLRGGDLSAHNVDEIADIDPASVEGYPELGRVWDICNDYPTLVWENVNSCGGNPGGGGSNDSDRSRPSNTSSESTAELAAAAGLTEAEYAAFLASGLTLEQFKASRLAATGPSSSVMLWSFFTSALLVILGGSLLVAFRARRSTTALR